MWYLVLSRPVVAREQMMGSLDDHLTWMRSQHEASNVLFLDLRQITAWEST